MDYNLTCHFKFYLKQQIYTVPNLGGVSAQAASIISRGDLSSDSK